MVHDTPDIVERTEIRAVWGHISGEIKLIYVFFVIFNAYFACFVFLRCENRCSVKWKLEQPFDSQLCHKRLKHVNTFPNYSR